jgi:CHAT domain-containing protein
LIDLQDYTLATPLLTTALEQSKILQDQRSQAFALKQWGVLYRAQNQLDNALAVTQQSLNLAQQQQQPDLIALAAQQWGELLTQQKNFNASTQAYGIAFNALQTLRSDLVASNPDVQFSLRDQVEPIYREYVSLLLQTNTPETLKQAREVIEALQLSELDNFFGDACLSTRPVDIDHIDSHAALLYPIILKDRLEVIVSLPYQPLQRYTTPLPQSTIERTIETLYTSFYPGYDSQRRLELSRQVYDWLIRPAEKSLEAAGIKTLVFVLDGNLKSIPMAALYDGKQYLIERYSVALSPGLQLLPPSQKSEKAGVLIAGISESRGGFPALPGVQKEVSSIAQTPLSAVLLNEEFTHPALQNLLLNQRKNTVHLATHGQFSADPHQTFLLAWDDRITVQELGQLFSNRRLGLGQPLDLLVMSACQSAAGDQRAVLGLAGMALQSGARSTIASLWSVNDEATAALMEAFYNALETGEKSPSAGQKANQPTRPSATQPMSKGEALRQAQLYMLHHSNDFYARNPYFWAGFVLVGNWR